MARTTPPSRPFVLGFACGRSALTATPHTRLPKPAGTTKKTASTHPDQRLDRPRSYMDEPPQLPSYAASPTTNDAPRAGAGSCKRLDSDRVDNAIGAVGRAHVATWADTATVLAAQCARPAPRPLCLPGRRRPRPPAAWSAPIPRP